MVKFRFRFFLFFRRLKMFCIDSRFDFLIFDFKKKIKRLSHNFVQKYHKFVIKNFYKKNKYHKFVIIWVHKIILKTRLLRRLRRLQILVFRDTDRKSVKTQFYLGNPICAVKCKLSTINGHHLYIIMWYFLSQDFV